VIILKDNLTQTDVQFPEPKILNEMAYPSKQLEDKLMQGENISIEHLLKIYYFRDSKYFNGWASSVYHAMMRTYKDSSNHNKFPNAENIFDWIWGKQEDCFKDVTHPIWLKAFNDKSDQQYQGLPYIHAGGDPEGAMKFIHDYYIWLAKELSKSGKVDLPDVKSILQRLLRKYPY
jgi:hypothetical protein